jgi:hypothetical protein
MKYKSIKISEELHKQIKTFCDANGYKINQSCELWLKSHIICLKTYENEEKRTGNFQFEK